jgi:hypothetical protein
MESTKAFDTRNRVLFKLRRSEAVVLVAFGYGQWRGRDRKAVTLFITKHQLIGFCAGMRFQSTPDVVGIDSRTHKNLGGCRGYKHVRTGPYSPAGKLLTEAPDDRQRFTLYRDALDQVTAK